MESRQGDISPSDEEPLRSGIMLKPPHDGKSLPTKPLLSAYS